MSAEATFKAHYAAVKKRLQRDRRLPRKAVRLRRAPDDTTPAKGD